VRRAVLIALVDMHVVVPRAAAQWRDAGAGLPTSVDLRAVTLAPDAVIAVGRDRATNQAAIVRGADGTWKREKAPRGDLVDVAAAGALVLAVGTDGATPLLLRRTAGGTWSRVTAPEGMGVPRAVALSAAHGVVADGGGRLFAVSESGGGLRFSSIQQPGPAAREALALDGLALRGDATSGVAVGAAGQTSSPFLAVDRDSASQAAAEPAAAGRHPVAAAATLAQAVAVDGPAPCREATAPAGAPGLWSLDPALGVWRRESVASATADSRFCDVALSGDALLVAGSRASSGAIWRRDGAGALQRTDLASPPLAGVAAAGTQDAWAVGDRGAVWRLAPPAPAPAPSTAPAPSPAPAPAATEEPAPSAPSTGTDDPPPPERLEVTVPRPGGDPSPPVRRPGGRAQIGSERLLSKLAVRRRGHRLVVSFRLRRAAVVVLTGRIGRRVVARHTTRTLAAGRRRVVVRFRGRRPPARLSIAVRPAHQGGKP
jgi:hypothetical protein